MGIRLRLYGCERMRRERLIGEAVVGFASINLELENNFWLTLEPRANTTVSYFTCPLHVVHDCADTFHLTIFRFKLL